jgi:cytochrome c553
MDRIDNDASNNSSIVVCIRCHGNVSAEPLPNNEMRL